MPLIAQVVQLAFSSGNWSGPCGSLLDASLGLSTPERGNWPPSFVREIHREWQWMDSSSWNLLFTNYNRKSRILITNEHISWSKNLKIGNYTQLHSLKITEYFSKNIFLYYSFKKKKKKKYRRKKFNVPKYTRKHNTCTRDRYLLHRRKIPRIITKTDSRCLPFARPHSPNRKSAIISATIVNARNTLSNDARDWKRGRKGADYRG